MYAKKVSKMHIHAKPTMHKYLEICIFKNMHKYAFYVRYMLEFA